MRAAFGVALVLALVGCAGTTPRVPPVEPLVRELVSTPFFPQEDYQCGPAALAMVLGASGVATHPDALVGEIYVPGREGSLQVEIVAAARRHGRLAYRVAPTLESIVREVASGRAVLVLVNFGVSWLPVWHYAVVIGYSVADSTLTLRSGRHERSVVPVEEFVKTWRRSDGWGLVLLAPGELPGDLDAERYLAAVIDLERTGSLDAARAAYAALLERLPGEATALFGLGSVAQRLGDLETSERAYRLLLTRRPDDVRALNNLALVLAERGCVDDARRMIAQALETTPQADVEAALLDSSAEIEERARKTEPGRCTGSAGDSPR
jgi:hypothetical protein